MSALWTWWLLLACSNPCIEMCQQAEAWLDRCGYGWSTVFADEGWATVDDCYDAWWDAPEEQYPACEAAGRDYAARSCADLRGRDAR